MEAESASAVGERRRVAAAWAPTLHALGHPDRLGMALVLAAGDHSVRELEAATGLGQSLVSYHLRELRGAGIVTAVPDGRSNRYRLCCSDLDELLGAISRLEDAARAQP